MTFGDIPDGAAVFIDANIFVYAFSRHAQYGPACRDLLERIDRVTLGQNGFIRRPQVRSKTSERINMAMSHRTPSHFSAMLSNSSCMASCNDDSE